MKNFLLISALVASLAANIWFAFARTRSPDSGAARDAAAQISSSTSRSAPRAASGTTGATTPGANTARTPYVWNASGTSEAELRAFAADLRAAGFPPGVIVRFVGEMLRERTYAAVAALPYWQLLSPGKETRKLQSDAARELLRLQEEILGPSGSQVATLDPTQRRLQYGSLGDDKVAALLRIDRDYGELRSELFANMASMNMEEGRGRQEQMRTLEEERLADISAALTPEEFAAWELRDSGAGRRVMNALRNLDVTEQEYLALFAAQKERDPVSATGVFVIAGDNPDQRATTYAFMDKVRTTLGDDRAVTYLKDSDFSYAQVASFAEKNPAVTPAKTFDLYKLQNEAQVLMVQARQASESANGPLQPSEQMRKSFAELNAKLDALLGAETAEVYRSQGMGGIFRAFSPPRRPPANTATPPKG